MNLKKFISSIGSEKLPDREFVLLDTPVTIKDVAWASEHTIFALAWTKDQEQPVRTYALCVNRAIDGYEISALRQFRRSIHERPWEWESNNEFIHQDWIQEWVKNNPLLLFEAGIKIGQAQNEIEIEILRQQTQHAAQAMEAISNNLQKIGITISLDKQKMSIAISPDKLTELLKPQK